MPLPLLLQTLILTAGPHGGQRTARRNAWAGMSDDAGRARARRDAEQALDAAAWRAAQRASTGS